MPGIPLNVNLTKTIVASAYRMNPDVITTVTRKREVAEPRMVCMCICMKVLRMSSTRVAVEFRKNNHATVLHAVKTVKNLYKSNREFHNRLDRIIENLPVNAKEFVFELTE